MDGVLRLLGPSWSFLGRSWRPHGASWSALGGMLGPLGRLLGRLRGDRGDQNETKITCQKKIDFQTPKRRILLQHGGRFGRPKSTKIGAKTNPNLRRFLTAKKLLFKSLLEPSWADLGAFWRPSWGLNLRSRTCGHVFGEKIRF